MTRRPRGSSVLVPEHIIWSSPGGVNKHLKMLTLRHDVRGVPRYLFSADTFQAGGIPEQVNYPASHFYFLRRATIHGVKPTYTSFERAVRQLRV